MPFSLSFEGTHVWEEDQLAEEPQKFNTKFAFAMEKDGVVTPLFEPVMCRDFLLDTMCWLKDKLSETLPHCVYGYDYDKDLVNFEKTELYVTGSLDSVVLAKVMGEVEEALGIEDKTRIFPLSNYQYYICGSAEWMKSTARLSMYTHLLRQYAGFLVETVEDKRILRDVNFNLDFAGDGDKYGSVLEVVKTVYELPLPKDGEVSTAAKKTTPHNIHNYSGWRSALKRKFNYTIYKKETANA